VVDPVFLAAPSLLDALAPLLREPLLPSAADADAMSALIDRCGEAPLSPAPPTVAPTVAPAAPVAAAPGPEAYLGCGFLPPDSPVSERFDDIDALFAPDLLSTALTDVASESNADILEAAILAASAVCGPGLGAPVTPCARAASPVPPLPPVPPPPAPPAPVAVPRAPLVAAPAAVAALPSPVSVAAPMAAPAAVSAPKPTGAPTPVTAAAAAAAAVAKPAAAPKAVPTPKAAAPAPTAAAAAAASTVSRLSSSVTTAPPPVATGDVAAVAASLGGLTEADFLSAPKLKRKKAKFASPKPSRFCHLCSRTPKTVRQVVCANIHEEAYTCRKVVCEKCFTDNGWDWEAASTGPAAAAWVCTHCRDTCPARSQCRTYRRTNERLRVKRLVEKFTTSAAAAPAAPAAPGDAAGNDSAKGGDKGAPVAGRAATASSATKPEAVPVPVPTAAMAASLPLSWTPASVIVGNTT